MTWELLKELASKKVGDSGRVICRGTNSYRILEENIRRNGCHNILPVNKGVAGAVGEMELEFCGMNFKTHVDTLQNILEEAGLRQDINFVKMDIEGYEEDVIRRDIQIISKADIISIEIHDTKSEIYDILVKRGFVFMPLTRQYCIKKLTRNTLLSHPTHFLRVIASTALRDRRALSVRPNFATGSFVRKDSRRLLPPIPE